MAKSCSYEVLSARGHDWTIESVYDDRDVALYEARVLLENRHLKAVKVIQETYDDETDRTISRTIFNEARGAAKAKAKPRAQDEAANAPAAAVVGRKTGESDFIKYLIILVLSIGGILLVVLVGAAFLVDAFGGG
jgi:preprotein translocase subunit SecF